MKEKRNGKIYTEKDYIVDKVLFGYKVKKRRNELKLTQEELAEKVDVSRTSIVQIENGNQGASLVTVYSLAKALDMSMDYLLSMHEETEKYGSERDEEQEKRKQLMDEINERIRGCDTDHIETLSEIIKAYVNGINK